MKHFFTSIFALLCFFANAQDIITLRNGSEVKAVIKEISQEQVKYKKWINRTGPTYTTLKKEIARIKFMNGTTETFEEIKQQIATTTVTTTAVQQPSTPPVQKTVTAVVVETPKPVSPPTQSEPIKVEQKITPLTVSGKKVYKDGTVLNIGQVESLLKNSTMPLDLYKAGLSKVKTGNILTYSGIGLVGLGFIVYSITTTTQNQRLQPLVGVSPNGGSYTYTQAYTETITEHKYEGLGNGIATLGIGVTVVGIIVNVGGKHKISKGINLYNSEKKLSLNLTPILEYNRLGVCMRF